MTFPNTRHADNAAAAERWDIAEKEAAVRVRSGYCPLCAQRVPGLAVTCGDLDCLQFMNEQPDTVRWLLTELHRLYLDNEVRAEAAAAAQDGMATTTKVLPVDWRLYVLLVTAGVVGAVLVLLALAVGIELGHL